MSHLTFEAFLVALRRIAVKRSLARSLLCQLLVSAAPVTNSYCTLATFAHLGQEQVTALDGVAMTAQCK